MNVNDGLQYNSVNFEFLKNYLKLQNLYLDNNEFKCLLHTMNFLTNTNVNKQNAVNFSSKHYKISKSFIEEHLNAMNYKSKDEINKEGIQNWSSWIAEKVLIVNEMCGDCVDKLS